MIYPLPCKALGWQVGEEGEYTGVGGSDWASLIQLTWASERPNGQSRGAATVGVYR